MKKKPTTWKTFKKTFTMKKKTRLRMEEREREKGGTNMMERRFRVWRKGKLEG